MSDLPKSTPGPWQLGHVVKHMLGPSGRQIVSPDATIAVVYGHADDDNIANARLIAAAPELAEALRDMHDFAEYSSHYRHAEKSVKCFERAAELLERVGY